MTSQKKVVTRMAPSPTGKFHVGGVRTALFNYLYARHHGGEFIIRSEDTDKERSKPEHEQNMLDVFSWLELDFDAFFRQSERTEIYQEHIKKLIDSEAAYEAEASNDDPDKKVIRFKNPNTTVSFTDEILGNISFDTTELGDFVIARNIDTPIYHLTVVVDDGLMEISHVIRGQEHINNTARQILILEALGFERPVYAHLPLIMSPRGGKLSKRDPEVIPALEYQDLGVLKEALINFLAFIGWNPGDEREVMTLDELIEEFDLSKVQKGGGVFNIEKLHWLNKQYLSKLSDEDFVAYLSPKMPQIQAINGYHEEMFNKVLPLLRERVETFATVDEMLAKGDLDYFFSQPKYNKEDIVWKKGTLEDACRHLKTVTEMIASYQGSWTNENIKEHIFPYAEKEGRGDVLWPLRFALSGRAKSPDPFTLLEILGKEESLSRITHALS
jgi:glutamyl-tRNA synthetase